MPSVRYYNQTAPFWDFIASLEEQGMNNNNNNNNTRGDPSETEGERPHPGSEGWAGHPWGPFPHRGHHGPPHHDGPPHHHHGPPPPPPHPAEEFHDHEAGPSEARGPPSPFSDDETEGRQHGRRHGPHGHHGPGHGPHRGPGARGRGGPGGGGRGRGGWGGRGRGHFQPFGMGPFGAFADMFQNQMMGEEGLTKEKASEDFKPDVDVFDTPESFVVHVSLPGAKKEDVGVNWDAEKSELGLAGVIYRPGDEELLKTLALDERKVGAFERKVRLGSRASPAQVDVDGITARMEDGVLRVEVPKLDAGYVEIKKVDIE